MTRLLDQNQATEAINKLAQLSGRDNLMPSEIADAITLMSDLAETYYNSPQYETDPATRQLVDDAHACMWRLLATLYYYGKDQQP